MPWFRLEDSWHSHPKIEAAGNAAAGLWARCGTYCAQYLTDGFVTHAVARRFGSPKEIAKVTEAGLWTPVEGGFMIDDYLDYNPTADAVKRERAAATERQRRAREAAATKRVTDMSRRDKGVSHGDVTDMSRSPRPVPTRPDPKTISSQDMFKRAVDAVVEMRVLAGNPKNPKAYAKAVRENIDRDDLDRITALIEANPGSDATRIARLFDAGPGYMPMTAEGF